MAKTLTWYEAVESIKSHVVRISTPRGTGTGFLLYMGAKSSICVIATAAHVIDHAHYWEDNIRLEHAGSGKSTIIRYDQRAVFIDENKRDTAAIVIQKGLLPFPENVLPLIDKGKHLKQGNDIGWVGYPAVAPANLCFFGGRVSAWSEQEKDTYLVDGVAINGVSGGPAFYIKKAKKEAAVIIGVMSAYIPNRVTGETLPGLTVIRGVAQFHELAPTFKSFDQAKEQETEPSAVLPLDTKSDSKKQD